MVLGVAAVSRVADALSFRTVASDALERTCAETVATAAAVASSSAFVAAHNYVYQNYVSSCFPGAPR